jgi:putative DNA methylase
VRRYGKWMRDEAEKHIGHLYPKVKISGVDATVIAWIWARTVTCHNPGCIGITPLVHSFWLNKKKGKERYIVPVPDGKRVRYEIAGPDGVPREGTMSRTGAVCLICDTPIPISYIGAEGQAGRIGTQLMAIAARYERQRYFVAPNTDHEKAADVPRPDDVPSEELAIDPRNLWCVNYGLSHFADLFTNRQLTTLTTLTALAREAKLRIIADATDDPYADAIVTYLALCASKAAVFHCTQSRWRPNESKTAPGFGRQALPMVWDFAETNPFAGAGGDWLGIVEGSAKALDGLPARSSGHVSQRQAVSGYTDLALVATDPPYYDNISYANLADFFYVWLRRTLHEIYPELTGTVLTPKSDELVADPLRHGGKGEAGEFFETGFKTVFTRICENTPDDLPITVFYAFKQAENDDNGGHASTGWETLLGGMIQAGWAVTATWPMRTEGQGRLRNMNANALASSIVLACRPRPADAGFTDRRGLIAALREEFPEALRKLEQGKVAPVDLRQAAIGPGMAVFSRYARVNEPDGAAMRVRAALSLINQVLDEKLSQLEGDVSAETRWCVEWFKSYGFDAGPFGTAETLSKGTDTSIGALERGGVLKSGAGKVKLLAIREIPENYDPAADDRTSEWEICLHLAKRLQDQGADATARLMAAARDVVDLDDVKELAYLLYSIAEKKGWAETALLFNSLGTSWTDLEDASRKVTAIAPVQGQLSFDAEDADE